MPLLSLRASSAAMMICVFALALGFGCGKQNSGPEPFAFVIEEEEFDIAYKAELIDLILMVIDDGGIGVSAVAANVLAWGDATANSGASTLSDAAGRIRIERLERRSVLLRLRKEGYYDAIVPVDLQRPLSETETTTSSVVLSRRQEGQIRFIFCGDTMFGRRFVDRDEDGIENEPEDLIHSDSRSEDARALVEFLRPLLSSADYTQVNLESPVIEALVDVHPYKEFKFHSHPETLSALSHAGIDAVSLGNNHVYDMLEQGMLDTLSSVEASGVDWCGAGMSETLARGSAITRNLIGVDFTMQAFNGILPNNFPSWGPNPWPLDLMYNAMDFPIVKGGSLELSGANIDDFLVNWSPGRFAIPVFHGGFEYGENPSKNMRALIKRAMENGAGIVVAHHPHTVYGVAKLAGQDPPVIAFLSLGNLLFDQDVFETFQSFAAVVDVRQTPSAEHEVLRVRLIPFHNEGYVPKLVSGDWARRIGRHVGHMSTHFPAAANEEDDPDGLEGVVVFPAGNSVAVCTDPSEYEVSDKKRNLHAELTNGMTLPIPFDRDDGADVLSHVQTTVPASCELGRDLMHYGDFEDYDVDADFHEGEFWNQSEFRFVENSRVRSGGGAFVLLRRSSHEGFVATWLKNRITFAEDRKLTVMGFLRGENAGNVDIVVRWYLRDSRTIISSLLEYTRPAGTYDWEPFVIDLEPPTEAGTIRVFIRHQPPVAGDAAAFLDDMVIIQWEVENSFAGDGFSVKTPNNWSWLRFRSDSELEGVDATLTHRTFSLR